MSETAPTFDLADAPADAPPADRPARERRLLDGVDSLRRRTAAVIDGERLLFVLGAIFVPLGFLLIMVAWYGASDTGVVFEQVPFLISGGLGGLGLMVVGGFLYNAWWLTRQVREARDHHRELLERHEELARTNAEIVETLQTLTSATAERPRRRAPLRAGADR